MSAPIYPDYYPRLTPTWSSSQPLDFVVDGATLDPKYTLLDRLRLAWFVFHLPYGLYNSLHMVQEARECLEAASDKDILDKDPGIDYLADADAELEKAEHLLKDMMGYEKE